MDSTRASAAPRNSSEDLANEDLGSEMVMNLAT